MSSGSEDLEHLISRFLDREITARERSTLDETIRSDPQAARLFAQTVELDRRVGAALRAARERAAAPPVEPAGAAGLHPPEPGLRPRRGPQRAVAPASVALQRHPARLPIRWLTPGLACVWHSRPRLCDRRLPMRWLTLGLAASLAGLFLLVPPQRGGPGGRSPGNSEGVRAASLFAPPVLGDAYLPDSAAAAAPQVRLEETERDWLVIPSPQPGEFLVVEVNRTQIRRVGIQQDF